MGRSRSRSRDRSKRTSSRERRSQRSRSRDRDRDRERDRRDRERRRSRSRSRDRSRRSSRSRSRDRTTRDRDRERDREREPVAAAAGTAAAAPAPASGGPEADRLARLAAWKARQGAGGGLGATADAAGSGGAAAPPLPPAPAKVWMPWEDPGVSAPAAAPAASAAAAGAGAAAAGRAGGGGFGADEDDVDDDEVAVAAAEARAAIIRDRLMSDPNYVPPNVAAKRAKDMADDLAKQAAALAGGDEEDPLDAFMASAVLPEVAQRAAEEEARRQEERRKLAEQLATGKPVPPLKILEESEDDDPDANPDAEIQIPANKVKLMIGPGGEKIKEIQKKSKARVQVKKEDTELTKGFGQGYKLDVDSLMQSAAGTGEKKMRTILLFGDEKAVEMAERLIMEALDNKEQKAKNREKEYEKKRETKRRERMLYHLRHSKHYEVLEVALGASKLDVKKAYRRLAMMWHPDKHPDNQEEAKTKFQEIQKAYDALMSSSEDDIIEQLADKSQTAA